MVLANASSTDELIATLQDLIKTTDVSKPARVVYAHDTRRSGPASVATLEVGLKAISAETRNARVTTTRSSFCFARPCMALVLDKPADPHAHHSSLTVPTVSVHRRREYLVVTFKIPYPSNWRILRSIPRQRSTTSVTLISSRSTRKYHLHSQMC